MGVRVRGKPYLLVIVDVSYGRPKVYPTAKEDVAAVVKALVNYSIPTHRFPRRL